MQHELSRRSQKKESEERHWTFSIKNHCQKVIPFTHLRIFYCPHTAPITRRTGTRTPCDSSLRNLKDTGVEKISSTSWTRSWGTNATLFRAALTNLSFHVPSHKGY
jgi:hypothetical protein